jgi:regulator of replication initiation timing
MFAHPRGRLTVPRHPARVFITHSVTLAPLAVPVALPFVLPECVNSFQFQGEFIFGYTPFPGTWAKAHPRSVTVLRFDAAAHCYHSLGDYTLDRHYCNAAVGAGRYFVLSFWPYEEEAMRTVWECLRLGRTLEKTLKGNAQQLQQLQSQVSALQEQLAAKDAELLQLRADLRSSQQEVARLEQEVARLRGQLGAAHRKLHQKDAVIAQKQRQLKGAYARVHAERQGRLAAEKEAERFRRMQLRMESQRNERLRLRDPIHIYALEGGRRGQERQDWRLVLDYHKGAHDLALAPPRADHSQLLEIVEHETVVQFRLMAPSRLDDISAALPLVPGRLCAEF